MTTQRLIMVPLFALIPDGGRMGAQSKPQPNNIRQCKQKCTEIAEWLENLNVKRIIQIKLL
jgi:hypothetical protein